MLSFLLSALITLALQLWIITICPDSNYKRFCLEKQQQIAILKNTLKFDVTNNIIYIFIMLVFTGLFPLLPYFLFL